MDHMQEVAQQLKDNPELARMLMEEQRKIEAQVWLLCVLNNIKSTKII